MSHYEHHLFFCTNQRTNGEASCGDHEPNRLREYAKAKSKELGLAQSGKVRVNSAGCLNRCELGPVLVVYPEAVWYTFVDEEDIDEIFQEHVLGGRIVNRLLVDQ